MVRSTPVIYHKLLVISWSKDEQKPPSNSYLFNHGKLEISVAKMRYNLCRARHNCLEYG